MELQSVLLPQTSSPGATSNAVEHLPMTTEAFAEDNHGMEDLAGQGASDEGVASITSFEMQPSLHSSPSSSSADGILHDFPPPNSRTTRDRFLKIGVGCLLFSCIIYVIVDSLGHRNIEAALLRFLEWVHQNPWKGALMVSICYIFATILFVPGSILTLGAGFAIGSSFQNTAIGVMVTAGAVFVGASIGSICSFLLGRYLFRNCVMVMAQSYPLFHAIDAALEHNGLKIMILLRLSPLIPFNALDYLSGITSIPLRDYALALVGILPGALMLSFVGASASSLSESTSSGNQTLKIISIVSGLIFGGCGVYAASYYSKLELDRILHTQQARSTFPSSSDSVDSAEVLLSDEGL